MHENRRAQPKEPSSGDEEKNTDGGLDGGRNEPAWAELLKAERVEEPGKDVSREGRIELLEAAPDIRGCDDERTRAPCRFLRVLTTYR